MASYTYVIGDIGGHADAFRRALAEIGADPVSLELPPDVTVVSVGDLIDRGPQSLECLNIARQAQRINKERWVQLVGNHEANWLEEIYLFYSDTEPEVINALREWSEEGTLYLAAYINDPSVLITHAGLSDLGSPSDPAVAAERINSAWGTALHPLVARPGMVLGYKPSSSAGVCWADSGYELLPEWLTHPMPFTQVHGHSTTYDWAKSVWRAPVEVIKASWLDRSRRHVHTQVGGRNVVGVDPSLGHLGTATWQPFRLRGTARVAGSPVTCLATARMAAVFADLPEIEEDV